MAVSHKCETARVTALPTPGPQQLYFFIFVVYPAMRGRGEPAKANPWVDEGGKGAEGLEWEVPSPAPFHTYETPPRLDASATRVIG